MGAKTWMLVASDGDARTLLRSCPSIDRQATLDIVQLLYPSEKLEALGDGDLSWTCPPDNEIVAACYPGITILASREFGIDYPSKLPDAFLHTFGDGDMVLHANHSVVDWLAFAVWRKGKLIRSLSVSPDSGILEDIGSKLPFEVPYWAGEHPAGDDDDDCPLPFHPLELGEAALLAFFGYQLEGDDDPSQVQAAQLTTMRFKRKKAWWRFGR